MNPRVSSGQFVGSISGARAGEVSACSSGVSICALQLCEALARVLARLLRLPQRMVVPSWPLRVCIDDESGVGTTAREGLAWLTSVVFQVPPLSPRSAQQCAHCLRIGSRRQAREPRLRLPEA